MMRYVEVLISSQRFHGDGVLTYSSNWELSPGHIVSVPLGTSEVLGIVVKATSKPTFKVKPVSHLVVDKALPGSSLKLLEWLRSYYPAPLGLIVSLLIPNELLKIPGTLKQTLSPLHTGTLPALPALNKEQAAVLETIKKQTRNRSYILHGATGSGKTRVYIELARRQLDTGKNVLILTPEISLTPQLAREFQNTFVQTVIILHSKLTPAQRRKAWLDILYSEQPIIVIGPRSALFAPFTNLGLIVVDEAHEQAYKQEQAPYYDARRVASKLAELTGSKLIFGTATPSISEYYLAEAHHAPILRMENLAVSGKASAVSAAVVLARDKSAFTRNPLLSDKMLDGIKEALDRGEQSLIFLNRRGSARLLLCQICGWQAMCPNCDLPLTYHSDHHLLRCHTCGFKQKAMTRCPECGSTDIIFKSAGTKALADTITKLYPEARLGRFDTDNLQHERFEEHFTDIAQGKIDILVGTQLLAKGLDLPRLGFVGVVSADTSLSFPDFTSEERTYQLLHQVIGRVGRGHRHGKAVIQTYHPTSPAIQAATSGDWRPFYDAELRERKTFGFPPFKQLLKISASRKTQSGAQTAIDRLATQLRKNNPGIEVIGPNPSFYEKRGGHYYWQLVIKADQRGILLEVIKQLPAGFICDIDPSNLL